MFDSEELLRLFNLKEEKAYRTLFDMYYGYLVLFARRYVADDKVAEDIVQDVFISIWEGKKEYNSLLGLKSYFYEAVFHRCADYLKHLSVEEKYTDYVRHLGDFSGVSVEQEEIYRELYIAIGELPERCRQIMLLALEGMTNQEIAEKLGLSVLTVKTHKKNAYNYLRKRLCDFVISLFFMLK